MAQPELPVKRCDCGGAEHLVERTLNGKLVLMFVCETCRKERIPGIHRTATSGAPATAPA